MEEKTIAALDERSVWGSFDYQPVVAVKIHRSPFVWQTRSRESSGSGLQFAVCYCWAGVMNLRL